MSSAELLARYIAEVRRARAEGYAVAGGTLLLDLPRWLRSQGKSGLDDRLPWITFGALRALKDLIRPTHRVFEYGSGGSTLFLSDRASMVVSVEHDADWHREVTSRLRDGDHVSLLLATPSAKVDDAGHHGHPHGHRSSSPEFASFAFCDYVSEIDRFPDGFFDIVLVDGRSRPTCFVHAIPKVRNGGWLILDNSERSQYADVFTLASDAGWPAKRHFGPGPYVPQFWETTIWLKSTSAVAEPEAAHRDAMEPDVA